MTQEELKALAEIALQNNGDLSDCEIKQLAQGLLDVMEENQNLQLQVISAQPLYSRRELEKELAELKEKYAKAIEELKKCENIIVQDSCEECNTFKEVRYTIKPVSNLLKDLGEKG